MHGARLVECWVGWFDESASSSNALWSWMQLSVGSLLRRNLPIDLAPAPTPLTRRGKYKAGTDLG